jgi:hypothetical protein
MTPDMIAALSSGRATLTGFYELGIPSGTRRLLVGSTEVSWGGQTWTGYDSSIGSLDAPDDVSEDMTGQAPNTSISINMSPAANRGDIAGQQVQLAPAKIYLTALQLDGSNHVAVVPDPELLFDGFIDQATIDLDKGRDDLEYTLISAFDYFFEDSEGQRLNGQFHRSIWAGEKGLDNVTGITKKIYWGSNAPPGSVTGSSSVNDGFGGGGGGGRLLRGVHSF